ncbi:UPF0488 protein CG14286 [Wyeomyia smithii]|uniref:UPF0488 protein CG14286 n=1 Tax=Wyeomyia smithii TaxID=174621 RepID=UPI002467DBC5|nr:UPF0488 protein CG14286 [Wyeomyia smithii]
MPPPRARLHKNSGKFSNIPKKPPSTHSNSSANGTASDSTGGSGTESDRQFELELYWCIQQLENTLGAPHIRENAKKVEDTNKLINTLKSASQPLIKKRQIMRTTFGDYRSKMAEEEKTMALNPESVRFDAPSGKIKHHFVKKAAILSEEKDYRFNFSNINLDDAESHREDSTVVLVKSDCMQERKMGPIEFTDNSFRFNFAIDDQA